MSQRFKIGDAVTVKTAAPAGHVRTPSYLQGKRGTIARSFGQWPNPEQLAYGKPGWPRKTNYWVSFTMEEIWGGDGKYGPKDRIVAEIYEHWLEPDTSAPPRSRK
ncbi:MAG: nitrile hydratase subunit beta [Proteobacteria bacterium]|nr:nitrile hydratase subunit beta [Pseudomonadota bacterium]